MKRNHKVVGLISTMSPDKTWAREVLERVSSTHGVVKRTLEGMGYEVLDEGNLHRSYQEMSETARSLRFKGVNAIVLYVGTWTYSNCAAAAALEAGVPVVVWADAIPGTCGLVGGAIARGAMAEVGAYANLVVGLFDDSKTQSQVRVYLDGACAAQGLKGQIMGIGGGRSMGMMTAVCDPNEVRTKFGIEMDSFEQLEVIGRAEAIPDKEAQPFLDWMKQTYGEFVAKDDVLLKQIKLYFALNELVEEKGYDFVAVRCLPELPALYTTFCLSHAIMGDAQDANGAKDRFVFSCEGDLNAAITMQMMKMLQDGPVLFTDLTQFDIETGVLTTCNCGSQPTDFACCKKDVRWEIEGVHEFDWKYGGCCPQHVAKPGRATLARLYRENGEYGMMIAPCEIIEMPREKLHETIWERPHTFVRLLCDREEFISAVRSNHIHLAYGDHTPALEEACKVLGVKSVILKEMEK